MDGPFFNQLLVLGIYHLELIPVIKEKKQDSSEYLNLTEVMSTDVVLIVIIVSDSATLFLFVKSSENDFSF